MRNSAAYLLTALFSLAAPTISMEAAWAQSATDVSQIAQEITGIIDGQNTGSATILGKQGKTYTILTNWHVLKDRGSYTVRTHDGQVHNLLPSSIRQLGNVDLATAQFVSTSAYRLAKVANSSKVPVGATVYVAGAPANLQGIDTRSILVVPGNIVGTEKQPQLGYSMIYNNNTMPGMSGAAVLNDSGQLVAIHGRGARDGQSQKAGFNLGIPVSYLSVDLLAKIGNAPVYTSVARPVVRPVSTVPNTITAPAPNTYVPSRPTSIDGSEGATSTCTGSQC
jgi:serine protease Do